MRVKEEKVEMELAKKRKAKWFFQRRGETISEEEEEQISRAIEIEFASHSDFLHSPSTPGVAASTTIANASTITTTATIIPGNTIHGTLT